MLSLVKTSGGGMNCRPKGRPTAVMAVVVDKYAEAKAGRLGFDWWICLLKGWRAITNRPYENHWTMTVLIQERVLWRLLCMRCAHDGRLQIAPTKTIRP